MIYIYVLKLKNNKYYIGKTTNPDFRLNNHFNSEGSIWTKKYEPISICELRPNCTDKDESIVTQEYMKKHGIDNVRGGPWCSLDISEHKKTIEHMIKSEDDLCYNCGKSGHFVNQCPLRVKKVKKQKNCDRCGREGHTINNCYATTDKYGNYLSESDSESDSEYYFENNKCFRCGRTGHYANTCYARTNVYGDKI